MHCYTERNYSASFGDSNTLKATAWVIQRDPRLKQNETKTSSNQNTGVPKLLYLLNEYPNSFSCHSKMLYSHNAPDNLLSMSQHLQKEFHLYLTTAKPRLVARVCLLSHLGSRDKEDLKFKVILGCLESSRSDWASWG